MRDSHHWPVWGTERATACLEKQRDLYKYMHDRTVRLMNAGYTGDENAEMVRLPPELESFWASRGYYGTLSHNTKAIYQRYMGWYDGNPANLHRLPLEPAAKKYVEYMGGEAAVLPLMLFDHLAVRVNGPKAAGKKLRLNLNFSDLDEQYGPAIENGVLNHGKPLATPDATLTLNKATLIAAQTGRVSVDDAIASGELKIDGRREAFGEFMGLLDQLPFRFNAVTP